MDTSGLVVDSLEGDRGVSGGDMRFLMKIALPVTMGTVRGVATWRMTRAKGSMRVTRDIRAKPWTPTVMKVARVMMRATRARATRTRWRFTRVTRVTRVRIGVARPRVIDLILEEKGGKGLREKRKMVFGTLKEKRNLRL